MTIDVGDVRDELGQTVEQMKALSKAHSRAVRRRDWNEVEAVGAALNHALARTQTLYRRLLKG